VARLDCVTAADGDARSSCRCVTVEWPRSLAPVWLVRLGLVAQGNGRAGTLGAKQKDLCYWNLKWVVL
jgi:hypothetical protein